MRIEIIWMMKPSISAAIKVLHGLLGKGKRKEVGVLRYKPAATHERQRKAKIVVVSANEGSPTRPASSRMWKTLPGARRTQRFRA